QFAICHPVRAALLLALFLLPFLPISADEPRASDPFPLRRILIPAERVAAEMQRLKQRVLVQMPRDEFEAKVKQATQAADRQNQLPRLLRASYTARLEGGARVGAGDWTVYNPGPGALPLRDLNLALGKIQVVDASGPRDAVLGELDSKGLALLLEKKGDLSVYFDWSLRGARSAGDLYFDLQVPACAVARLELTLPADHAVLLSRSTATLAGPPRAAGKQRIWDLSFAGRSRVDVVIRRTEGPGHLPPLLLAQLQTSQQLAPGTLLAEFDFQV